MAGERLGLGLTLAHGAAWTTAANVGASLLNFIVALALARLLAPGDFGVHTAVITVTAFFSTLTDTGLGSAVVQREDLDERELSSIFWGGLALMIVAYGLIVLASPLAAHLFSAPALTAALPVGALGIIVSGAMIVPTALLRRRLDFGAIARARGMGTLAGAGVAVLTALAGGRYWALIGYSLTSAVVNGAFVRRAYRWTPAFSFEVRQLAKVRGYAGSMTAFVTVNYWARNLDHVFIGRFLGLAPLGLYSFGQQLVSAPLQLLTGSLAPLLHPTFAAMGDDVPRQRAAYLDLVRVTALLTFPGAAMLWVLAEPVVRTIAGDAWLPSVPVMRALAPLAAIQPVNMLCGAIFMARDAAHVMLRCSLVGAAAVVAGMLYGLQYGIAGVAWGYTVAYLLVSAPVATLVAYRLLQGRMALLARALGPPLIAGAAVLLSELALSSALADTLPPTMALTVMIAFSVTALALLFAPTARRVLRGRRTA